MLMNFHRHHEKKSQLNEIREVTRIEKLVADERDMQNCIHWLVTFLE